MAGFGLPGGSELVVIGLLVVFLFAPGVLIFWLGYLTGKRAGAATAPETLPPTGAGAGAASEGLATAPAAPSGGLEPQSHGEPAEGATGQGSAPGAEDGVLGAEPERSDGAQAAQEDGGPRESLEEEVQGDA